MIKINVDFFLVQQLENPDNKDKGLFYILFSLTKQSLPPTLVSDFFFFFFRISFEPSITTCTS